MANPLFLTEQQWINIPNMDQFMRPTIPGLFTPPQQCPTNAEKVVAKA